MMKQTHTHGGMGLIQIQKQTQRRLLPNLLMFTMNLWVVSLAWEFQVFAYEGKGTQASKIMNLGFPDTDLTFALSL